MHVWDKDIIVTLQCTIDEQAEMYKNIYLHLYKCSIYIFHPGLRRSSVFYKKFLRGGFAFQEIECFSFFTFCFWLWSYEIPKYFNFIRKYFKTFHYQEQQKLYLKLRTTSKMNFKIHYHWLSWISTCTG